MHNRTADGGTVGQLAKAFGVNSRLARLVVLCQLWVWERGDPASEAGPGEGWLRLIFRQTDNQSILRRRHALLVALLGEIRLA